MEFLQILLTYSSKCNYYFMQKALAIQMINVVLFIVGKIIIFLSILLYQTIVPPIL